MIEKASSTVVVRFAPSPTGYLHIGNARAALINWLFAQKNGGTFLLRIDDTDLERSLPIYEEAILRDLSWLGLTHDRFEKQSLRFDRYRDVMAQLIAAGRLYPCYETTEELDFKRKRQIAKGQPPLYDRAALTLTEAEKRVFDQEGRKPHWRFKLTPTPIIWHDMVRGPVHFHGEHLSDPVLVRADGAFLYTFSSVIDDVDFNITHIIRGEDHVTNTAVQLQLFEALQAPHPITFGHTTLLTDVNGQALSKRLGSLSLENMRAQEIEPMAINSLLARLGTSLPIEPFTDLETLAQTFDMATFSRTPPHFDENDLYTLNHKIFTISSFDRLKERIAPYGMDQKAWDLFKGNIRTFSELKTWQSVLSGDFPSVVTSENHDFLRCALSTLPQQESWHHDTWKEWTQALKEKTGRKEKDLFMPLRQALTGKDHGPEMKDLILLLGHDTVKNRLAVF